MRPEVPILCLLALGFAIVGACITVRLSAPHVKNGKWALRVVLALCIYGAVRTCAAALTLL